MHMPEWLGRRDLPRCLGWRQYLLAELGEIEAAEAADVGFSLPAAPSTPLPAPVAARAETGRQVFVAATADDAAELREAAPKEEEVDFASLANSSELRTQGRGPIPRE